MAHEKLRPEYVFDEEKIAQLKQLAPECFEDGKINFTTLSQNLGDWRQDEEDPELEHFGLFWPGKRDARKAAAIPPEGTLEPVWGDGLKADGTPDTDGVNDSKNIFIEGENLEVLKLLQKSYAGKIKMIYIDPPYNTGNDFVYDDDFTEPLQEYLRRTGQVDEEGKTMTTNKRSDGRFHSKWLSMMYPRLRLARNLLREDGVIFVSIDDNEVHNLKALMNEIFGEENCVGCVTWLKKRKGSFLSKGIISLTEYCLVYTQNPVFNLYGGEADSEESQPLIKRTNSLGTLKIPSNTIKTKLKDGNYSLGIYGIGTSAVNVKNDFVVEKGIILDEINVHGRFIWSQQYLDDQIKNGAKLIVNTMNFQIRAFKPSSIDSYKGFPSFINGVEISGTNEDAYEYLKMELGIENVFSYTKPINYLKEFIRAATIFDKESIVLDFFAGSGSFGHAVNKINEDENYNLKYIQIQLPQIIENIKGQEAAFEFCKVNNLKCLISEIAKFRLRKVHLKSKKNKSFKVLRLKKSNFKPWKNYRGTTITDLENELDLFNQNPLCEGFTQDGLFAEIILLEGFTLCSTISQLPLIQSNTIRKVTSEYCDHALLVCLDKEIAKATVSGLQLGENDIFICLDSAISTEDKLRLSDKGLIKTI